MNIAIIQSRMGSHRLPGKMMKKLGNYSVIEWVIRRLKKTKSVDKIILATSKKKKDKIFKKISKKLKINFFAGKENDVLQRFTDSVSNIKKANIIRICADNPFIDPLQIDLLVSFYSKNKFDYVCNHQNKLNSQYADGFGAEILSLDLLRKLNKLTLNNKEYREHVTLFIWKNKKKFKIHSLKASKNLAYPELKFDIDTLDDFKNIKSLIKKFKINIKTEAEKIIRYRLRELKKTK
jgi:spore coat polysaccharide biosynthesis protein SpsF